jgi:S-layer protein
MGAGDDTVVYAAAGAGGSLNGGDGNDTLVVSADSAIAGLPEVSGFEVLRAVGSATHNAHTFKALEVGAGTNTFTNVAAGVGLTVLANATSTTVTLANATGTADVFDLTLKSAASLTAGTVALAGVETININSVDTDTSTASGLNTSSPDTVAGIANIPPPLAYIGLNTVAES